MDSSETGGDETASNESEADSQTPWECQISEKDPDFALQLGCADDFLTLASLPLNASIPGARSTKTVIDRFDDLNELYFQNSEKYGIHYEFVSAHLSGSGKPPVPMLRDFNRTEYYAPDRRFLLGSLTHYEGPDRWAYELAPYDTASAEMIENAFRAIRENSFIGDRLEFHPTSEAVAKQAEDLPDDIPIVTTDDLFDGVQYQALNLAEAYGRITFLTAEELENGAYPSFRDIVVLDAVPNDISVVLGIITGEFQTPLSHINVLSKNRGTPNMALRDAYDDAELRALDGKWVRLSVEPFDFEIEEVSQEEADTWWDEHKPDKVGVPGANLDITELTDIEQLVDVSDLEAIKENVKAATRAFGGKAAHYSALAQIPEMPSPKAFSIPIVHYFNFMDQNGFTQEVEALLDDPDFASDPALRDMELHDLRERMKAAPLDEDFEAMLYAKLQAEYPGVRMRFRSSTNAEDLDGFTGAGLYTSKSATLGDPEEPVPDAIRKVWASVWFFRAFEERSYRSIEHTAVGMAMLVHHSFPDEEANGVALTGNPFDTKGLEPGFYINVQFGEASVVQPDAGVFTDQLLIFYDQPNQPVSYISHSNLIPSGTNVLTQAQVSELGDRLHDIREFFRKAYGPPPEDPTRWYAMDVEFKIDDLETGDPKLWVKQARPHGQ